jgi:hypothetical protein
LEVRVAGQWADVVGRFMRRDQTKRRVVEGVSVGQAERVRGTGDSRVWRSNVRVEEGKQRIC